MYDDLKYISILLVTHRLFEILTVEELSEYKNN